MSEFAPLAELLDELSFLVSETGPDAAEFLATQAGTLAVAERLELAEYLPTAAAGSPAWHRGMVTFRALVARLDAGTPPGPQDWLALAETCRELAARLDADAGEPIEREPLAPLLAELAANARRAECGARPLAWRCCRYAHTGGLAFESWELCFPAGPGTQVPLWTYDAAAVRTEYGDHGKARRDAADALKSWTRHAERKTAKLQAETAPPPKPIRLAGNMEMQEAVRRLREWLHNAIQLFETHPGAFAGIHKPLCGTLTTGSQRKGTEKRYSIDGITRDVGAAGAQFGLDPTPLVRLSIMPLPERQETAVILNGLRWLDEFEVRLAVAELTPPTGTPAPSAGTSTPPITRGVWGEAVDGVHRTPPPAVTSTPSNATPGTKTGEGAGIKPPAPENATPSKPPTRTERTRKQRLEFCRKRYAKGETWNEIFDAYRAKYPKDENAGPDTLRHTFERNKDK